MNKTKRVLKLKKKIAKYERWKKYANGIIKKARTEILLLELA